MKLILQETVECKNLFPSDTYVSQYNFRIFFFWLWPGYYQYREILDYALLLMKSTDYFKQSLIKTVRLFAITKL